MYFDLGILTECVYEALHLGLILGILSIVVVYTQ